MALSLFPPLALIILLWGDALAEAAQPPARTDSFAGAKAGGERDVAGIKLCWCPPGRFRMGSPRQEPERRPGETQVEVTVSKGFWMGKYEVMQGQWKRVVGEFPGKFTAGEGDDFPVYTVNFAEAEQFCRKLTESAHASGELPNEWEFRLPTEAQWEYRLPGGDDDRYFVRQQAEQQTGKLSGEALQWSRGGAIAQTDCEGRELPGQSVGFA